MDAMVSARVPAETKKQGDNVLKEIGSSATELVNACAQKMKADSIVTGDERGFRNASTPHGSASDFMEFVFQKTNVRYAIAS